MRTYILDGSRIKDLKSLFVQFGEMISPGTIFGHNLRSFDDRLFGGYGLENPCKIIWKNAAHSKKFFDHNCLVQWCASKIANGEYIDDNGHLWLEDTKSAAEHQTGMTMFDLIVDMISSVTSRSLGGVQIFLEIEDSK